MIEDSEYDPRETIVVVLDNGESADVILCDYNDVAFELSTFESGDGSLGIVVDGQGNERVGNSISNAEDVNGDGIDDSIVGAVDANSNTGAAYLFYGLADLVNLDTANADVIFNGASNDDQAGL